MPEDPRRDVGTIAWADLTVGDAECARDSARVIGWGSESLDMGGYGDFCMTTPGDRTTVAGVCHVRNGNASLPAVWLMYVLVGHLDASLDTCRSVGGMGSPTFDAPAQTGGTASSKTRPVPCWRSTRRAPRRSPPRA